MCKNRGFSPSYGEMNRPSLYENSQQFTNKATQSDFSILTSDSTWRQCFSIRRPLTAHSHMHHGRLYTSLYRDVPAYIGYYADVKYMESLSSTGFGTSDGI